ncbi:transglycosylase SLT domain-containing protein [Streptomyces sp. NPDC048172]|uniref:transglycosylase SLT domain-containing protein n=1 Tax=Streptomyces sp. NPDC048172 TaxID=3365505 RepID=UPI00371A2AB2
MPSISGYLRNPKAKKISAVGISAAGAAALALTVVPGSAEDGDHSQAAATISAEPVAFATDSASAKHESSVAKKDPAVAKQEADEARKAEARKDAAAKREAERKAEEARKAEDAKADAAARDKGDKPASRSAKRAPAKPSYPDNLDGWIREARSIMKKHGIPGSYDGIKRNIIRESGGDPNVSNDWDINAKNGVPSKGLLQVIQPTFDAYHVKGTPKNLTDPVANIVAACNYAADRYGSMDNVDSAY